MNIVNNAKNLLLFEGSIFNTALRFASKKTSSSTKNSNTNVRPKHRGIKINHGKSVHAGNILVTQRHLRFHPGLNVGLGKNGTLFALRHGTVHVTCEKVDLNWDHTWVQRNYNHRKSTEFFKKYFNVIAEPEHQNFKLINQI